MKVKLANRWTVDGAWTSAMIQCLCGEVFQAHGSTADVSAKQREWNEAHKACERPKREGSKIFWLSFCDPALPTGQQFLGVCLVDVTGEDAEEVALELLLRFPLAQPGAEWIAAATRKAHRLGCNPGGEVASYEIDAENPNLSRFQRGVLMDRATVTRINAEIAAEPSDLAAR